MQANDLSSTEAAFPEPPAEAISNPRQIAHDARKGFSVNYYLQKPECQCAEYEGAAL